MSQDWEMLPRLPDDDVVDPFRVAAQKSGLSEPQLRRETKLPDGPVVTRLSARRVGITRRHFREWLARRTINRPANLDAREKIIYVPAAKKTADV